MQRFRTILRERKIRWSGTVDRWWVIVDKTRRDAKVASILADYPNAEYNMRSYCAFLNREESARAEKRDTP